MIKNYTNDIYKDYTRLYSDFKLDFGDNFNFAFDIADKWAELNPGKRAIVWCNEEGEEREFTFSEIKYYSDKCANLFKSQGVEKGDAVMRNNFV